MNKLDELALSVRELEKIDQQCQELYQIILKRLQFLEEYLKVNNPKSTTQNEVKSKDQNESKSSTYSKTEPIFWKNTYLFEFDSSVTGIEEENGSSFVILDATIFYPQGGLFDSLKHSYIRVNFKIN